MVNPIVMNQKGCFAVLIYRPLGNVEANKYEKHESYSFVHLEIEASKLGKGLIYDRLRNKELT